MNKRKLKAGVACLVIDSHSDKFYLSQRKGVYEKGKFACPGGMVDDTDDDVYDAIVRELNEEMGLTINKDRCKMGGSFKHIGGKSDFTQWFWLKLNKNEVPINMEPKKHTTWLLYSWTEALGLPLMVSTNKIINEVYGSLTDDINDSVMKSHGFYRCNRMNDESTDKRGDLTYWTNQLGINVVTHKKVVLKLPDLVEEIANSVVSEIEQKISDKISDFMDDLPGRLSEYNDYEIN